MASFASAFALKEQISKSMLKKPGIHGIGVGMNQIGNLKAGAAIIIYTDKVVVSTRSKSSMIYRKHGRRIRVPVHIHHCPKFCCHSASKAQPYQKKVRPLIAGYSIGTAKSSGTAGLIVTDVKHGGHFVLSNNHVLNATNSAAFSPTLQPGGADGGTLKKDRIGKLNKFIQLQDNQTNYLDAALSKPLTASLLAPKYAKVGCVPGHVSSYRIGDTFKKVGRTSGLVTGKVHSIHTDTAVSYFGYARLSFAVFKNQTVIKSKTPVSLPGDSGSVWLTSDHYAAAVNFAGSSDGKLSIAYPVEWFMQVFGTRTALPKGAGTVKTPHMLGKEKRLYTQPLSTSEIQKIRVQKARCHPWKKTFPHKKIQ
ncbi:hypothetical protein J2Z69_001941 [Paenibacillus shirakamiensis]|uniref:Serine protease n=1 Tax=Paenibacillus shirakamiensis TaxID=1265935 RepID=A0ABS4JGP7_9BACL|nr:hypothetical protein [Paenibacillus shirakamiensis]MBP2000898.1 hypothetical protein [Paenibacillus shirakamiensis]